MVNYPAHLILKLNTKEPIEIGAFVGVFSSLSNEYNRFVKDAYPDLIAETEIFIREVRAGSIEADMIPWLQYMAPFISEIDKAQIVEEFVKRWGERLYSLVNGDRAAQPTTRSELKDWSDAVEAIARDPNSSAELEAATFEDGQKQIRAAIKFNARDARIARDAIESRRLELETKVTADHNRVLMVFTRTDIHDANLGKPSGERVKIEEVHEKPLSLTYASQMAEEKIKHHIREDVVYKLGFVVNVNVRLREGKPVAYAVTDVHEVVELPDD